MDKLFIPDVIIDLIVDYTRDHCLKCNEKLKECTLSEKYYCRFCDKDKMTVTCVNCGDKCCCIHDMLLKCWCCDKYVCHTCERFKYNNPDYL